ncbi:ATP-binding protein [Allorhizocola rhizosphaerae]|uniref:ATP-binding protein n=1 Tax=Allorhizocola rhizosphaerae TaxID=1872709 RepID=UPI000E3D5C8D|nr:ATP-binding protein [Allorhizocola rhizosphaerae]
MMALAAATPKLPMGQGRRQILLTADYAGQGLPILDLGAVPAPHADLLKALQIDRWSSKDSCRAQPWLGLAAMHRSYLYEHQVELNDLNPAILTMLEKVGKAAANLALITVIHRDNPTMSLAFRIKEMDGETRPLRLALVDELKLQTTSLVGKGVAAEIVAAGGPQATHTKNVLSSVALQVLGVASLLGAQSTIEDLVCRVHAVVKANPPATSASGIDVYQIFQAKLQTRGATLSFDSFGPDHDKTFVATVIGPGGHTASHKARSKKDARRLAITHLLIEFYPELLPTAVTAAAKPVDAKRLPPHMIAYSKRLAAEFGVPARHHAFAAALVHSSWIHEATHQRDTASSSNAVLAHFGSFVVTYLVSRLQAQDWLQRTWRPDSDEATIVSVPSHDIAALCDVLDASNHVLTGQGQRTKGLGEELSSDVVQAVFAAAYLSHEDPRAFEQALPMKVHAELRRLATKHRLNTYTRFIQHASSLKLSIESTISEQGADHAKSYDCETVVFSAKLGESVAARGRGSSKGRAQQAAADKLVAAIEATLGGQLGALRHGTEQAKLAKFFLRHQLVSVGDRDPGWHRWIQRGYLAGKAVRANDFNAFRRWALSAAELVANPPHGRAEGDLADYYAYSRVPIREQHRFSEALRQTISWIHECHRDGPANFVSQPEWRQLLAVCAAQKIKLDHSRHRDVKAFITDWTTLYRDQLPGRVKIMIPAGLMVSGQAAGALAHILSDLVLENSGITAIEGGIQGPHMSIRLYGTSDWHKAATQSPVTMLVGEAAEEIRISSHEHMVQLRVDLRPKVAGNWILGTWNRFDKTGLDSDIGRVLHDIKNELLASQVSIEQTYPSRTAMLAGHLQASRHLDTALMLAIRLADVSLLYSEQILDTISLPTFFRSYLNEKTFSVPETVRLVPPTATEGSVFADQNVLRAVLDNLVKNAIEAMPGGGQISFDWSVESDGEFVSIGIVDSGPGVPRPVINALERDDPIASTKRHGTGIGLMGSRRMMRAMGGTLDVDSTSSGGRFNLRVPSGANPQAD